MEAIEMTLGEIDVNEYGSQQLTATTEVVHLVTPTELVWCREVKVDSATILTANESKNAIEFDPNDANIPLEGEWVTLDTATGEAALADSGEFAYLVYAGRGRLDVPGSTGVTVLSGPNYVAETTNYVSGTENAAFGVHLYVVAAGGTNSLSTAMPAGGIPVARFEGYVSRRGTQYIRFRSH
jgi:hypothetical protein